MTSTTYNFPSHIKGDTMAAVVFTITVNGAALNLTGATVKMDVRPSDGISVKRYTSLAQGGLTIGTPTTGGVVTFDSKIVDFEPAVYKYDIEFTLADTTVHTYISGTMTIVQDVTYG